MKGVVPLYRAFRKHLLARKKTLAPIQLLGRMEDYLTKEFAGIILSESGGQVLPMINVGKRPEGRRIDIALAEGDLSKERKLTIRGFIELKYVRNRHRWGPNTAYDETGTAFKSLEGQLQRVSAPTYAGQKVKLRGARGDTYGLVFASFVSEGEDKAGESEFVEKVIKAAKRRSFNEASRKAPTLRRIYTNAPVELLKAKYRVSLYVGLWRL